jgi:hypothetical protein
MAEITEIGANIYRINVEMPGKPVTFSLFLIDDEQPTLVETSYRRVFAEVLDAVRTILDPATIRHIVIPHLRGRRVWRAQLVPRGSAPRSTGVQSDGRGDEHS